jgi:hypothetical protein
MGKENAWQGLYHGSLAVFIETVSDNVSNRKTDMSVVEMSEPSARTDGIAHTAEWESISVI